MISSSPSSSSSSSSRPPPAVGNITPSQSLSAQNSQKKNAAQAPKYKPEKKKKEEKNPKKTNRPPPPILASLYLEWRKQRSALKKERESTKEDRESRRGKSIQVVALLSKRYTTIICSPIKNSLSPIIQVSTSDSPATQTKYRIDFYTKQSKEIINKIPHQRPTD